MFPRRLSEVTAEEIRALIDLEVTESADVEFKREMPFDTNKGSDPWVQDGKISEHSKDVLGSEIVAFANTGGGTLIIGIEEEKTTKKAEKLTPVPNCKKLAERLHQSLTRRIEPRLPVFECEGVVTETDQSSGVVIMRTLPSYLFPHRMTSDNHCYIRRNDRSEPMSMAEIQEAARRAGRSAEDLDRAFSQSSKRFYSKIPPAYHRSHPFRGLQTQFIANSPRGNNYVGAWALRLTARPFAPLPIGTLPKEPWLAALQPETLNWPAPGSEDTELGVLMEPEVRHGTSEVYAGVQA
jgi:hypothetical protein